MSGPRLLLDVFGSRKMAALSILGFSSGLPLYLTSRTLQAWMTLEGVSLNAIGWLSLVALPYSLKFLWAPVVDRYIPPFLGRRRGWLAISQAGLMLAIAAMSLQRPAEALTLLAANAFVLAFLSATQDIVADAYRADILTSRELGAGMATFVLGYRVAMLLIGAAAFVLADRLSWPAVYLGISALMLIGIAGAVWAQEPPMGARPPETLDLAIRLPFQEFFRRQGAAKAIWILAFIAVYRLGDSLVNIMSTPFLLQAGFTQTDVGTVHGGMGLVATIVGVMVGGAIVSTIGVNRSLWVFGAAQALSNLMYLLQAIAGRDYALMVVTVNVEDFCVGLGTASMVSFLMSLCNPAFSATQYALLSSLMAVSRDVLAAPAGRLAELTGWPLFFLISFVAALPGLALLPLFAPWRDSA